MRITFLNQNSSNNLEEIGRRSLASRSNDFEFYMNYGTDHTEDFNYFLVCLQQNCSDIDELDAAVYQNRNLPPFHEFGLSYDYVEGEWEEDEEGEEVETEEPFFRYQISWGGPSEEVRFYEGRTEYVYLDWFCGVGFDVTGEDWAEWLREEFDQLDMMDFEAKLIESKGY